ncbi:uncharacterized protein Z518_09229 [Rhinocladiella mackenziei CBS 650.93]|uniref:Rhinocladiella mackenziei CBS 650.93 unplaced genomic scaffold supercont1.7, whole genome shotgun sequence n=1 Tax=Rhinocladiella mackenziei CBS 650.93 TaxID=1442369 RepID=A0A0D2GT69_9EURO|nr:uncharacterized protein Z518_09229 [Rhinocladiella mackenziei CBS 650.93]KIX01503.1 hypothetical protein Z518_09229 [Rhinocladiella mackenziei CBS 650.93]
MERIGLKCSIEQNTEEDREQASSEHHFRPGDSHWSPIVTAVGAADMSTACTYPRSEYPPVWFQDLWRSSTSLDILPSVQRDVAGNIDPYFKSFNKWLPVVDASSLYRRCDDLPSSQDAEFSILLLTCVLLARVSQPSRADDKQQNDGLYMTISLSLTSLTSKGSLSLEMLQAEILLALYEHLDANHVAAAATIASAAVIAGNLGLFQWQCQAVPSQRVLVDEEMCRVAWCLYILERMIKCIHYDDNWTPISFSCPRPCPSLILSDEDGRPVSMGLDMGLECTKRGCCPVQISASELLDTTLSFFNRLCQASFLLELSLDSSLDPSAANMVKIGEMVSNLDKAINMLASSLLRDRDRGSHMNCSILGICVSAMMILHDRAGKLASLDVLPQAHSHQIGLTIATRMVFDRVNIVPTLQYQYSQVISLWELHCFYFAAEIYLRYDLCGTFGKNADIALQTIKRTLERYRTYWKLASQLLSKISAVPTPLIDRI